LDWFNSNKDSLKNLPYPRSRISLESSTAPGTDLLNPNILFRFVTRYFLSNDFLGFPCGPWPRYSFPVLFKFLNMTSTPLSLVDRLQTAIDLAQTLDQHSQAQIAFQELVEDINGQSPLLATLLQRLWKEYLSSQRSSLFWEQLSTMEKQLSDQLTESHLQLKQNYLRLIQEQ